CSRGGYDYPLFDFW
nr:immunoglobulin heavy chain junction region [Mus musculus]